MLQIQNSWSCREDLEAASPTLVTATERWHIPTCVLRSTKGPRGQAALQAQGTVKQQPAACLSRPLQPQGGRGLRLANKNRVLLLPPASEWQESPLALGRSCPHSGPWFSHLQDECVGWCCPLNWLLPDWKCTRDSEAGVEGDEAR